MGKTTELRREIKSRFVPYAAERGFSLDERLQPVSTIYRRQGANRIEMFELQWDKYGSARFVINFGMCPVQGLDINGKSTPAEDVLPTWCNETGTLQPRRGSGTRSWFRQDSTLLQRLMGAGTLRQPSEVADELLALFPEVERYWVSGTVGPHLKVWKRDPTR